MRWTERQRAMLREMGVGPWQREDAVLDGVAAPVAAPAAVEPTSRPASRPADARPEAPSAADDVRSRSAAWPAADWLVVAEPPAADSAAAEAQLLDNLLRAIGLARERPMRTSRAAFLVLADGDGDADTDPERLQAALAGARPGCILAFGRAAARAVLGSDEPLGVLRAAEHRRNGVPVVVTCSLAFLLRHADEKARVWAELCRAVRAFDAAGAEGEGVSGVL